MKGLCIFSALLVAISASYIGHPINVPVIGPGGVPIEPLPNQLARAQHAAAYHEAALKAQLSPEYGPEYAPGILAYGPGPFALAHKAGPPAAHGPPIIGPNGVPIELPPNQAARAQHAAAYVEAAIRAKESPEFGPGPAFEHAPGIFAYGPGPFALAHKAGPPAAHGPPIIGPNGVPIELPPNQKARAEHAAAVAEAKAREGLHGVGPYGPIVHYGAPLLNHDGTPVELPENQLARAQHALAFSLAKSHYRKRRSLEAYPIITPHGVPEELPANKAARAQHAAAVAEAKARNGEAPLLHYGHLGPVAPLAPLPAPWGAYGPYAPLAYAPGPIHGHGGPQAFIGPDGQPIETPEVQHLKAKHFAAHAEARARIAHAPIYAGPYHY